VYVKNHALAHPSTSDYVEALRRIDCLEKQNSELRSDVDMLFGQLQTVVSDVIALRDHT
jgi:hypothetical protein